MHDEARRKKRPKRKQAQPPERIIQPQQGPQTSFCASPADIVVYGGAAGGGKSWSLVFDAARYHQVPGYHAIGFRRTYPELTGGGSLWEETEKLYPLLGAKPTTHKLRWKFPSGATVQLSHMQREADVNQHQSKQYAHIFFDEITSFTGKQWGYMLSRARTTCGVQPRIRAGCNPDPDSFLMTEGWLTWYINEDTGYPHAERSGVLRYFQRINDELVWGNTRDELLRLHPELPPLSFTFIAAKLDDNEILMKADPSYRAKLLALSEVDQEQLLHGNWKIRPERGQYFKPGWFSYVDQAPSHVKTRIRAWDKAASEPTPSYPDPDYTVGTRMSIDSDDVIYIEDVVRLREKPLGVDQAIVNTAKQDGNTCNIAFWRDPGQAGKIDARHMARILHGYNVHGEPTTQNKISYASRLSAQVQAGNVALVRGPWNKAFVDELEGFPQARHDDQVDSASLAYLQLSAAPCNWLHQMFAEDRRYG